MSKTLLFQKQFQFPWSQIVSELYPFCGYKGEKRLVCDSLRNTESNGNNPFFGVRLEEKLNAKLTAFSSRDCFGEGINLGESVQCSTDANGGSRGLSSFAFENVEKGCILFYNESCFAGNPVHKICDNVPDLTLLGGFSNVWSFIADAEAIEFIVFHQMLNFVGSAYSVSAKDKIFNVNDNKYGYRQVRSAISKASSISLGKFNKDK